MNGQTAIVTSDVLSGRLVSVGSCELSSFSGSWVHVFRLETCLNNGLMSLIAQRLNQCETVFLCPGPKEDEFNIYWYSPNGVLMPGGAGSMAAAHLLFEDLPELNTLKLLSRNRVIEARREISDGSTVLELPTTPTGHEVINLEALSMPPDYYFVGLRDLFLVYYNQGSVDLFDLEMARTVLNGIDYQSVVVTEAAPNPSESADFVYRVFYRGGQPSNLTLMEDHASLSPLNNLAYYWSSVLSKSSLFAWQPSAWDARFLCDTSVEGVLKITDICHTIGSSNLNLSSLDPAGLYSEQPF